MGLVNRDQAGLDGTLPTIHPQVSPAQDIMSLNKRNKPTTNHATPTLGVHTVWIKTRYSGYITGTQQLPPFAASGQTLLQILQKSEPNYYPKMTPCEHPEGIPSKCHNKVKNPMTNRKVMCAMCKVHSDNVRPGRRRASTQKSKMVWQSIHDWNFILNKDLTKRNARLQNNLGNINQTNEKLLEAIRGKLIERAKLKAWPNLADAILLPSTTLHLPEAPPRPLPTPSPPPTRRPTRKRKQIKRPATTKPQN